MSIFDAVCTENMNELAALCKGMKGLASLIKGSASEDSRSRLTSGDGYHLRMQIPSDYINDR